MIEEQDTTCYTLERLGHILENESTGTVYCHFCRLRAIKINTYYFHLRLSNDEVCVLYGRVLFERLDGSAS